jgi:glycosyltransferase involved in cell wall biosynthesis
MKPTLHVLANPHGITDLKYRMDPFNIAVAKFIGNMLPLDWPIIHYGHEHSQVNCEHVSVIFNKEVSARGADDLFVQDPRTAAMFCSRTRTELKKRYKPGDLILCFFGQDHSAAVKDEPDWIVVEPSIGYRPECIFAPYRVFTSHAVMNYFYGMQNMLLNPSWFDAVIPNAFSPDEFGFSDTKQDYLVYLGRVSADKGIDLAIQVAEYTGKRLIIAGPGDLRALNYNECPLHVEMYGYVDMLRRKQVLRNAYALIAPTHYLEPFGNIVVEAAMCGTPAITTDWGGFSDTVLNGHTGYRCKSFMDFVQAVEDIPKIRHQDCRDWAMKNYSESVVHQKFDRHLQYISSRNFYHGKNTQPSLA